MIKQQRKKLKKKPRSNRYDELRKLGDPQALHTPEEAIALVKKSANARFVETVDLSLRLGIDPKKSDQNVRGTLNLPYGTGKTRRVAVLAKGTHAESATSAGADEVGAEDLVEKIVGGYKDFDVLIAHQEMAPHLAKIGRVLGPRTPSKASGTLTDNVAQAVKDIKSAVRVEFRNDKAGIVHMPIGKVNMTDEQLLANFRSAIEGILKAKPQTAKGRYLVSITLSSSMGPGFRVDPQLVTKST